MKMPLILIIESDEWLAEQYARVLRNSYKILLSTDANEAIKLIDDNMPDLIVTDILLTGGTVFALLHELQSYGDTGAIPIIVCTNSRPDISIDNLMPYGVRDVLDKTLMTPDDLVVAIKRVLE